MKRCNALDFDDLLTKTYELLKTCDDVRDYFQDKFKYIHVDEFQDTNEAQYLLVKLLAGKYGNVFVVGDEDQCIYSWRGAEAGNVVDFTKDFRDCKVFKLERNYRSTKKLSSAPTHLSSATKTGLTKIFGRVMTTAPELKSTPLITTLKRPNTLRALSNRWCKTAGITIAILPYLCASMPYPACLKKSL